MGDILVDGYNVIKNNTMFQAMEIKDFSYARLLLVKQLYSKYRQTPHRVVVVFDGDGAREQVNHQDHIRIIYSRHGETADRVIARLAAEAQREGREVTMYSDDEEVRRAVSEQGGKPLTTTQLTQHLNAAPRDVAIRSAHRQAIRRAYGIDPWRKAEYDDEPYYAPGKKKKSRRK